MTPQLRLSIDLIRKHNIYRKPKSSDDVDPLAFCHAIETVCTAAESLAKQLDELQDEVVRMNDTKKQP